MSVYTPIIFDAPAPQENVLLKIYSTTTTSAGSGTIYLTDDGTSGGENIFASNVNVMPSASLVGSTTTTAPLISLDTIDLVSTPATATFRVFHSDSTWAPLGTAISVWVIGVLI